MPSLDAVYHDPEGLFSINYPSAWQTHRSGSEMQFWAEPDGSALVAVSVRIKVRTPEDVIDDLGALFARRYADYEALDRREGVIAGYPALWVDHAFVTGGIPQRCTTVAVVRHRVGVLVLSLSPIASHERLARWLDAMVETLAVAPPVAVPPYDAWRRETQGPVTAHAITGSYAAQALSEIAADHAGVYKDVVTTLGAGGEGIATPAPIAVYLYPSQDVLHGATARRYGFAIAEANEVHALWASARDHQSLGHEMTHVLAHQMLGEPYEALLGEGLAVCLDHATPPPHDRARALPAQGDLPAPTEILGDAWFEAAPDLVYPASGSFVCYLVERCGMATFAELYRSADLPAACKAHCGATLDELMRAWQEMLIGDG